MNARKYLVVAMLGLATTAAVACDDDEPSGPDTEVFVAVLNGANERPNPVTTTATGTARVEFTPTGLTFNVTITNAITAVTAAHIHSPTTPTSETASVVLNLNPTLGNVAAGAVLASGTATTTNSTTVNMDSLKAHIRTGRAYVNVHNTPNTGGHIRGTLVPGN